MTVAVVEGSSTVCVVEEVIAVKATVTTGVVMETKAKMAHDAADASGQGGRSIVHRAGKEVAIDVLPSPQGGAGITEEEEEEYINFFSKFFGPASIVGSSAFRSRN